MMENQYCEDINDNLTHPNNVYVTVHVDKWSL